MASFGRKDVASYGSANHPFLDGSAAISSNEGNSSPAALPCEMQLIASLCSVFCGPNVPANSELLHPCVSLDSATCEALGVVSPVSLYRHKDTGCFIYQNVSNSGMPTAPPSTAGPERYEPTVLQSYVSEGINNLLHVRVSTPERAGVGVPMDTDNENDDDFDDDDGQMSEKSYYASSTASTSQTKQAPKKPSLTDTLKLQTMQDDCSNLNMEELRSVMVAAGRVILGKPLSTRKIKWDEVKVAFMQHGIDPARCHEPNNAGKSTGGPKPNQQQLLDMAAAVKSILDEKCKLFPDYLKLYEREAEEKFASSIQVHDSDTVEGVVTSMALVSVQQHNKQPATSSLQTQCRGESANVISSVSLSSNIAGPFFDKQHAPVSEDDVDSSYVITTSQPDYMRRGLLGVGEIHTRSVNSAGNLNDIQDISSYAHAAPTSAEMSDGQSSCKNQNYSDYCQNNAVQFGKTMAPARRMPAAYAEMLGKFQDDQLHLFSRNYSDHYNTMKIDAEIAPALEGQPSEEFNQPPPPGGEKVNEEDFMEFVNSLDENEFIEICLQIYGSGTRETNHGVEIMEANDLCPPSQMMLANTQALLDNQPGTRMTEETPLEMSEFPNTNVPSVFDRI